MSNSGNIFGGKFKFDPNQIQSPVLFRKEPGTICENQKEKRFKRTVNEFITVNSTVKRLIGKYLHDSLDGLTGKRREQHLHEGTHRTWPAVDAGYLFRWTILPNSFVPLLRLPTNANYIGIYYLSTNSVLK